MKIVSLARRCCDGRPTGQAAQPHVPEIRKGDTVVVLSGKDAGKRGTVERVIRRRPPSAARSVFRRGSHAGGVSVVVEGINIAKRHTKPRQSTGATTACPRSAGRHPR
jgi:ribosomal protein L24